MTLPSRNNLIARMHKGGHTAPEIARHIGCGESYVRVRLRKLGYSTPIRNAVPMSDGIWGLPERDLRKAVAKRAAAGAKATRESQTNRELAALSTQLTGQFAHR